MEPAQHISDPLSLLHLPDAAKRAIVALLSQPDRRSLRLACSTTARTVNEFVRRLNLNASQFAACSWQLNQRFPQLKELNLICGFGAAADGARALQQQAAARLVQGGASSVTELSIDGVTAEAAATIIAASSNVEVLQLLHVDAGGVRLEAPGWEAGPATDTILSVCASMHKLTELVVSFRHVLGDAELVALAGLPKLAALDVHLGDVGAIGWEALGSMRLSSLTLPSEKMRMAAGAVLDLSAMTTLTQLQLGSEWENDHHVEQDPAVQQQERQLYQALHLPASLREAALQHVPGPPLGQLTALRQLQLTKCVIRDTDLRRLSDACPALARLKVCELVLTAACHAAPLFRLQSLRVHGKCTASADVIIDLVFPSLCSLKLCCECELPGGGLLLEGANLFHLDLGRAATAFDSDWAGPGLSLQASDFAVLQAMPSLSFLRLNAEPEHLKGLMRLPDLDHLELVCNVTSSHAFLRELQCAFLTSGPPAQLTSASITFSDIFEDEIQASDADGLMSMRLVARVADAAVMYFVLAPALSVFTWESDTMGLGALSPVGLLALSCGRGITHVRVVDGGYERPAVSALEAMMMMLASSKPGLHVEIL